MTADDLTRRARAAITGYALYGTPALVSELADEMDRLRAENERLLGLKNDYHQQYVDAVDKAVHAGVERDAARAEADRFRTLWDRHGKNDLLAERDAARAALGRVTELLTLWARLASRQANLGDVVDDLTRALEGES